MNTDLSKVLILDIETSGINPRKNGMLSLGATNLKRAWNFYGECRIPAGREVNPYALGINGFTTFQCYDEGLNTDVELLHRFVASVSAQYESDKVIVAGHNVGSFDIQFLNEIAARGEICLPFSYRTIDLHSLAFGKYHRSMTHKQICEALHLPSEPIPHNALSGARSEAAAIELLLAA